MAPDTATSATNAVNTQAKAASYAYVTFLTSNGDYVKGVVRLAKGLSKAKTIYPLVAAVLPDVPEEHCKIMIAQGCIVKEIVPVCLPKNKTEFAISYYMINYSKLRIWNFVEYGKMIYLDADIQAYDNIDHLFDLPDNYFHVDHLFDLPDNYFHVVMDCFCEKTWSQSSQCQISYCHQCPDKVAWPASMGPKPSPYFNGGMFVFEPDHFTYNELLKTLQVTVPTIFAEQDFLNIYFRDEYSPISNNYNLVLAMLWRHRENIQLKDVKVVHYCAAGSKP